MSPEPSPNTSKKRDHDVFQGQGDLTEATQFQSQSQLPELEQPFTVPADFLETLKAGEGEGDKMDESLPTPPISVGTTSKRERSASVMSELTDAGADTPSRGTSPVNTNTTIPSMTVPTSTASAFAALGSAPPPAKKAKLSFQEKEMRKINKEIKDRERAEEKARKDAERQAQVEEKARKEAEKEAERKKREVEKEEKRVAAEAEKAAKEERRKKKEEDKLKREEEKLKKEEEKQKAEEEKRKKERGQMKLNNFFAIPTQPRVRSTSADSKGRGSMSPAPQSSVASLLTASAPSPAKNTPSKPQRSAYEKLFPDFFVQNGVTLAPTNRFERDAEAAEVIQTTIDSYILGNRSPGRQRAFDATELFHLSPHDMTLRGRYRMPVREIMTEFYSGKASRPIDLTTDSQNSQIKRTTDLLKRVPMKFLQFQEDVRPPYRGTYTARPVNGMAKLARNPLRRDLPETNYDYDSEAEWIEDEDAEDLTSERDEEEDLDEDEDMEGFLDDEGDETSNSKRLVLQGDLEPVSTGLCWEDRKKRNTNVKMVAYRMEMILDPTIKTIDPFSTAYWDPPQTTSMDPPRIPLNSMRNTSLNFNGQTTAKPTKSFFTPASDLLKSSPSSTTTTSQPQARTNSKGKTKDGKPQELLPLDKMDAFKQEIQQGCELTKLGLVEVLKTKFRPHTAAVIKATLDAVAKRGPSKNSKWVLLDDVDMVG